MFRGSITTLVVDCAKPIWPIGSPILCRVLSLSSPGISLSRRNKKPPIEGAWFGVSVREGRGSATTKEVRDALSKEFAEVIANRLAEGVTGAGTSVGDVGACRGVVLEGRFF